MSALFEKHRTYRFEPDSGAPPTIWADSAPEPDSLPRIPGTFVAFEETEDGFVEVSRQRYVPPSALTGLESVMAVMGTFLQGFEGMFRAQRELVDHTLRHLRERENLIREENDSFVRSILDENRIMREAMSGFQASQKPVIDLGKVPEILKTLMGVKSVVQAASGDIDRSKLAGLLREMGESRLADEVTGLDDDELALRVAEFRPTPEQLSAAMSNPHHVQYFHSVLNWARERVERLTQSAQSTEGIS